MPRVYTSFLQLLRQEVSISRASHCSGERYIFEVSLLTDTLSQFSALPIDRGSNTFASSFSLREIAFNVSFSCRQFSFWRLSSPSTQLARIMCICLGEYCLLRAYLSCRSSERVYGKCSHMAQISWMVEHTSSFVRSQNSAILGQHTQEPLQIGVGWPFQPLLVFLFRNLVTVAIIIGHFPEKNVLVLFGGVVVCDPVDFIVGGLDVGFHFLSERAGFVRAHIVSLIDQFEYGKGQSYYASIIVNINYFMSTTWTIFACILIATLFQATHSLYCEPENCYELLEISQTASQQEVKKAFRLLARRLHPDRNKQEDTTQIFQKINIAYEVLDNENTRQAYDLFLNDPSGFRAYHTYQYYKASYSPQTNPFLVIFIFLLLMSWLQYVMRKQMYQSAFDRIIEGEDFRKKVNEECINQGKKGDKRAKEEIAEKLQEEISIEGGYSKPDIKDLLIFKVLLFPYLFTMYVWNCMKWVYKYYILRKEYEREDQEYLTKKALKIPVAKWEHLESKQREELLGRELWVKKNMKAYQQEMQQKQLQEIKISNPAKYRKIMAYLKKKQ